MPAKKTAATKASTRTAPAKKAAAKRAPAKKAAPPVPEIEADAEDRTIEVPVPADATATLTVGPSEGPVKKRIDIRLAITIALGVGFGFVFADLIGGVVVRLQSMLIIILVSLFLSLAMEPAVQYLADRRGWRRGAATGLVFLVGFFAVVGFIAAMAPLVIGQITNLVDNGPEILQNLSERAASLPGAIGEGLSDWLAGLQETLPDKLGGLGQGILGFGSTLLGGLLQGLTIALVTFYLVADGPRLRRALSSRMEPATQREVLEVWEMAIAKTGGYVYGRALVAIASAVFHAAAFQFIGLSYSVALGVWVGVVSSLIPVIGTYIAGALPIVIAIASPNPIDAVFVILAVVIYQQVENYVVSPRITAKTMEVHPAIAFVSVLVGGALLGAVGALLALPAAAIIGALVSAIGERHEVVTHELLTVMEEEDEDAEKPEEASAGGQRS